ncbi:DUF3285 domain-containing protein [Synechococcus sp. R55.6]|jgi:hypothetical protein|uniref:DUF3285 domain-containing protein n=1 Tax=unclassified Synechococcus TaxID=2626047 RepID=UPI0039C2B882
MAQPSSADSPSVGAGSPPQLSYTRLAMRNMVRKGKTSLLHFTLTAVGLVALLVGLAYLFH